MTNIIDFKNIPKKPTPPPPQGPPIINLPPMTKWLIIGLVLAYVGMALVADEATRTYIYLNYGFIPAIWTHHSAYEFDMHSLFSPLTYIFLHGSWMHLIMNATMLMAFGAGVEKWMGGKKFLIFFFLCGIAAVALETLIHPLSEYPVIGASGAESGLFAAILILMQAQGRLPTGKYGILPFAAIWIGLSIVFGFFAGPLAGGQIAWATHLGGFIAGFGLLKLNYFRYP